MAFKYYQLSSEEDFAEGQFYLGFCYYHGLGTEQDEDLAFLYYSKAADQGHPRAQKAVNTGRRTTQVWGG